MTRVNVTGGHRVHNGGDCTHEDIMGYRSFFVHIDDSDQSDRRLAVAAQLARAFCGDLEGVYVVPTRELTPFTSAMLPDSIVDQRMRESGAAQERAQQRFSAAVTAAGLKAQRFSAPAGKPIDAAILHTCYTDIAVVGQPLPEDEHAGFANDLVHGMLLGSGRPVLLVPHFGAFPTIGGTVLVAWKETRESARAVCDALPFLKRAHKVVVMSIAQPGDNSVRDSGSDAGIVEYLARHDIEAKLRQEVADDIDVGNLLLSRAADLSADLIVMGAYSRPRLAEIVLGGVTRLMLGSMTVPVLMSH